jgi:hypothetical protein
MVWALALVAAIAVGLPVGAWLITRHLPAPRGTGAGGAGYDAIDRWLVSEYGLPSRERWRVRDAVFGSGQVSEPALIQAVHELAARVLAGGFRTLRLRRVAGWMDLAVAAGLASTGLTLLVTGHGQAERVIGWLALINCVIFLVTGVARALVGPRQIRRHAEQALRLNNAGRGGTTPP